MPGCPFCLDVSPSALQSDLDSHIKAKHNVQSRDDSGFEVKVWKVQDREFEVLEKQPDPESNLRIYRCPSCVTEAHSTACMITHIERKHIVPWNQKIDNKEWTSDEKKLQKVYCDLCWMDFPNAASLNTHQQYDKAHKKRVAYTQGSGCDLCRTIPDTLDMETHLKNPGHRDKVAYEAGSGCDLCKTTYFLRFFNLPLDQAIARHNQQQDYLAHDTFRNYKPGSGCDLCCLQIVPHEETKKHKTTQRRKDLIYKRYILPRITAKSARK
mmetsp:Transcript_20217/g.25638  ORF Transcript_20217/g.25638 Transcript_20217/m.25638 type:complete len:268 (-) Transcript_20217:200-1003(-)